MTFTKKMNYPQHVQDETYFDEGIPLHTSATLGHVLRCVKDLVQARLGLFTHRPKPRASRRLALWFLLIAPDT